MYRKENVWIKFTNYNISENKEILEIFRVEAGQVPGEQLLRRLHDLKLCYENITYFSQLIEPRHWAVSLTPIPLGLLKLSMWRYHFFICGILEGSRMSMCVGGSEGEMRWSDGPGFVSHTQWKVPLKGGTEFNDEWWVTNCISNGWGKLFCNKKSGRGND